MTSVTDARWRVKSMTPSPKLLRNNCTDPNNTVWCAPLEFDRMCSTKLKLRLLVRFPTSIWIFSRRLSNNRATSKVVSSKILYASNTIQVVFNQSCNNEWKTVNLLRKLDKFKCSSANYNPHFRSDYRAAERKGFMEHSKMNTHATSTKDNEKQIT